MSDTATGTTARAEAVLAFVVKGIVDNPDAVKVSTTGEDRLQINIEVGDGDMGRVIGRRGRVANAIRAVGRAAAAIDGLDVDVEFVE
ncbi:MAG: KH domain-containing protein [Microthrixaceae bacterium]